MSMTIGFYKIFIDDPKSQFDFNQGFIDISTKKLSFRFTNDYPRDLFAYQLIDGKNHAFCFRKVRTDEVIEVGQIGEEGELLDFKQGQGKIETNHFIFFPQFNTIAYIHNIHGNHFTQLEKFLRKAFEQPRLNLIPLLKSGSVKKLLSGKTVLKITAKIGTNQPYTDTDTWSDQAFQSLAQSQADFLEFTVSMNTRKKSVGYIDKAVTQIENLLTKPNIKQLKAQAINAELNKQWIDFLGDKIEYHLKEFSYTKEKHPHKTIYDKITTAYNAVVNEIENT